METRGKEQASKGQDRDSRHRKIENVVTLIREKKKKKQSHSKFVTWKNDTDNFVSFFIWYPNYGANVLATLRSCLLVFPCWRPG